MKNKFMNKNPEKWREYINKWRAENKDKIKAYRNKNKNKLKIYYSQWIKNNKEKVRLLKAEWYQKNKEKVKENGKKYYKENNLKINLRRKKWRSNYPERTKAQRVIKKLLLKGIIQKLPCKVCNNPKTEAHHDDYTKPNKIVWLCKIDHSIADKKRRIKELNK